MYDAGMKGSVMGVSEEGSLWLKLSNGKEVGWVNPTNVKKSNAAQGGGLRIQEEMEGNEQEKLLFLVPSMVKGLPIYDKNRYHEGAELKMASGELVHITRIEPPIGNAAGKAFGYLRPARNTDKLNQTVANAQPQLQEDMEGNEQPNDDQPMPNILGQVVDSVGVEINPANEEELRQAVTLFVNTYGGDQNQTDFMKQLQGYLENSGSADVNTQNLRYSGLSPMGQQVFDQLELLDPSMGTLNSPKQDDNSNDNFMAPTSNINKLSFSMNETKSFLKDKIMEALNQK
jgi:hypothetical protein